MPPPPGDNPRPRCPTCGSAVSWQGHATRPFCSVTRKLLDPGGWLDEAYRVPGPPLSRETSDPEPPVEGTRERG